MCVFSANLILWHLFKKHSGHSVRWIGSWITLKMEDFVSLKSRGAGPVPCAVPCAYDDYMASNLNGISKSTEIVVREKFPARTHFALCVLPLSRRSRCVARHLLWLSSIIENPKNLKVCKCACRTEAELETGHTHMHSCTFPVCFFGFAFIFNSTICWVLSPGSCC